MLLFSTIRDCTFLIAAYMIFLYIIAQLKKDNSLADRGWAIGFLLVTFYSLIKTGYYFPRQILVTLLIFTWATRLTLYITIRNWGKGEDHRYQDLRKKWGKFASILSFFLIFIFQGTLILIISYEVILINTSIFTSLSLFDFSGFIIWIFGFIYENIADIQLFNFLKNPSNKGHILKSGLWRYSRHPNYFGEILMWWGLFIIAVQLPYGVTALVSPLTISFLILFVSGIPLAEKQMEKNSEFVEYKKITPMLIPWFE